MQGFLSSFCFLSDAYFSKACLSITILNWFVKLSKVQFKLVFRGSVI